MSSTADRAALIAAADSAYRDYPAWAGHWDDWLAAAVGPRNYYRSGTTWLRRGEPVLIAPTACPEHEDCRVAFSPTVLLDIHVPTKYLTIAKEPTP